MISNFTVIIFFALTTILYSQNELNGVVIDEHSGEKLPGVNIVLAEASTGTSTNANGEFVLSNIPNGKQKIIFSHIGYENYEIEIVFPYDGGLLKIEMESHSEELEDVFVNATRSSRTIDNEPTRVEVIAGEEIDEKISMDPSNISMLLNESTGINVQQTSASSANNTFRIQGLDGRYTMLLKDGFPFFGGYSGSLSIVQVPPLDLKQVEIIKGSSSTLYGGGAIAGLINLISKFPSKEKEISFLVNVTSALGLDLSGYYSQKFEDYGFNILASRNTQKAYDNNDDEFSDLPKIERYTITPKLFFYFDKETTLEVGVSYISEERIGGDLKTIDETNHGFYIEKNLSDRLSSQVSYNHIGENESFSIKNSLSYFERDLTLPDYSFDGIQFSTYSEFVYKINGKNNNWLFGLNLTTENFDDKREVSGNQNFSDLTAGLFTQNSVDLSDKYSLEVGLRLDYNKDYGAFLLPRVNLLIKFNHDLSSRIGGGLGYKIPSIFTEKSDELAFRNILPIDKDNTKAEKSYGFNFDVNYKTILFDKLTFSINNLFFYTRINDPLFITYDQTNNFYQFQTYNGFNDTKGFETNIKFSLDHYKLFAGYSYTDVKTHSEVSSSSFPLTPKHSLGIILIYEIHGNLRIGLEAYYTGKQTLSNGINVTDYWINGLMIEKRFENVSLFLNFENFLDTRQSKYGVMFTGSRTNPIFSEIYAPTDGRIINGGIKLSL